jgi:hypothetical protein
VPIYVKDQEEIPAMAAGVTRPVLQRVIQAEEFADVNVTETGTSGDWWYRCVRCNHI